MPALTGNGLAMRLGIFLEALAALGPTQLVVIPVSPLAETTPVLPEQLGATTYVIPTQDRWDTQFTLIRRLSDPEARLEAFRRYGRPSLAAACSTAVLSDFKRLVDQHQYRLVHVARSYLSGVASALGRATPLSLDLDEDEATSYRQMADERTRRGETAAAKWLETEADGFDRLISGRPERYELFISSPWDRDRLMERHPHLRPEVVGNAVAVPVGFERRDDGRTLVFVGSFGYEPNVAGCLWFAADVWPQVRALVPAARLRLVGRNAPRPVLDLGKVEGIEVIGSVDDIAPEYAAATIAIAPLRAGTGTRIKMIEAAAFAMPIVATRIAAQGLEFRDRVDVRIADDPIAFAACLVELLTNPGDARALGENARSVACSRYDRADIITELSRSFASIIGEYA